MKNPKSLWILALLLTVVLCGCGSGSSEGEEEITSTLGTTESYFQELNSMMEEFLSVQSEYFQISTVYLEDTTSPIQKEAYISVVKDLMKVFRRGETMSPPESWKSAHFAFSHTGEEAALVLEELVAFLEEGVDFGTQESIDGFNDISTRNVETATAFVDSAYGMVESMLVVVEEDL